MYGYIDTQGQVVIKPQFENASDFSEGLAAVKSSGRWGFIDKSGKVVIPLIYNNAGYFSEGVAAVEVQKGQAYYVNIRGKPAIKPLFGYFQSCKSFSEGLAAVEVKNKYGFVDRKGRFVIKPVFSLAGRFRCGLANVITIISENSKRFEFIDKSGNVVIKHNGNHRDFSEMFAIGTSEQGDPQTHWAEYHNTRKYFVSTTGERYGGFCDASDFSEGLAAVKVNVKIERGNEISSREKWGYIDRTFSYVIEPKFDDAYRFSEGLARANGADNGTYESGFIDTKGNFVIRMSLYGKLEIDDYSFSEELVSIKENNKYGFINKAGEVVIKPQFKRGGTFHEGLAKIDIS